MGDYSSKLSTSILSTHDLIRLKEVMVQVIQKTFKFKFDEQQQLRNDDERKENLESDDDDQSSICEIVRPKTRHTEIDIEKSRTMRSKKNMISSSIFDLKVHLKSENSSLLEQEKGHKNGHPKKKNQIKISFHPLLSINLSTIHPPFLNSIIIEKEVMKNSPLCLQGFLSQISFFFFLKSLSFSFLLMCVILWLIGILFSSQVNSSSSSFEDHELIKIESSGEVCHNISSFNYHSTMDMNIPIYPPNNKEEEKMKLKDQNQQPPSFSTNEMKLQKEEDRKLYLHVILLLYFPNSKISRETRTSEDDVGGKVGIEIGGIERITFPESYFDQLVTSNINNQSTNEKIIEMDYQLSSSSSQQDQRDHQQDQEMNQLCYEKSLKDDPISFLQCLLSSSSSSNLFHIQTKPTSSYFYNLSISFFSF